MMMSNGQKKGTIEWNCQRSNQIRLAKAAVIVRIARRNAKGGTVLETKLSVSEEEQAKKHTDLFTPPPPQHEDHISIAFFRLIRSTSSDYGRPAQIRYRRGMDEEV